MDLIEFLFVTITAIAAGVLAGTLFSRAGLIYGALMMGVTSAITPLVSEALASGLGVFLLSIYFGAGVTTILVLIAESD